MNAVDLEIQLFQYRYSTFLFIREISGIFKPDETGVRHEVFMVFTFFPDFIPSDLVDGIQFRGLQAAAAYREAIAPGFGCTA